ncbi:MAG: Sir2 family NAD-dependent protein deacetylase [Acidimicrobiia bacterium]|nr:Sir2 family NAD-dependent protein deacetylase [Acidimicrobiia bacterium]MDX2468794.1 Sir2 family NAD-dependent protein deacetylase [Acidimicrobiia bacterium]
MTTDETAQLAGLLAGAERILIFTGAGISTASGIPDYRGPQGVWKTRQPVYYQDFMASESQRQAYWQQKMEDAETWGEAPPNAVHHAIVDLEAAGRIEMVVTQNVDGLHALAGTSKEKLVEIHGTNREIECQTCGDRSAPEPHFETFSDTGAVPQCHCGGFLKAATISFGQSLRADEMARAYKAADRCDLVVALGSTLAVNPAASIPLHASERGTPYVIVNRGATDHDRLSMVTMRIDGDVAAIVPMAVATALAGSR